MSAPSNDQGEDMYLYLHAELLPNIRHVTLYLSVPVKIQNKEIAPCISLSESRRSVTVSLLDPFDYISDTIKLPARVRETSRRLLTTDRQAHRDGVQNNGDNNTRREYSFRMQIDSEDESLRAVEDYMDSFVPWTAADMSSSTKLRCSRCEQIILGHTPAEPEATTESSMGFQWKDLPSGNWAEMMDFWHCHKPDTHEKTTHGKNSDDAQLIEDQNSKIKGYGAANQVRATPGTVLVDVATFLVSDLDCRGLKKASREENDMPPTQAEQEQLLCKGCDAFIGVEDTIAQGWRLFKTSLSASVPQSKHETTEATWEIYPIEIVIAAQLLELIERESVRRFVVHCGQGSGLLIWVFNPDMRYSSSSTDRNVASQRAMKIFFQTAAKVDEMLNPSTGKLSSLSLEELRLPSQSFDSFCNALEKSNLTLPASAGIFREWKVGILHRFERSRNR